MSVLSLQAAVRGCTVGDQWAAKIQSDRFLNPNNVVCPMWAGVDSVGRMVCADSFMTKTAGCASAEDRVQVENMVTRPQYFELIGLGAGGLEGDFFGGASPGGNTLEEQGEQFQYFQGIQNSRQKALHDMIPNSDGTTGETGQYGLGTAGFMKNQRLSSFQAPTYAGQTAGKVQVANESYKNRQAAMMENYYYAQQNRHRAGF